MKKPDNAPKLRTPGVLAEDLGQPLHRVLYVLRSRQQIRPTARAGRLRLFDIDDDATRRDNVRMRQSMEAQRHTARTTQQTAHPSHILSQLKWPGGKDLRLRRTRSGVHPAEPKYKAILMSNTMTEVHHPWQRPAALLLSFSTRGADRFTYDDGFLDGTEYVDRVNAGKARPTGWTIGKRCRLSLFKGCPVFLVRTGQVNPGVIMSGALKKRTIEMNPGANRVAVQWQHALRWKEQAALSLESVFGNRRGKKIRSGLQQSGLPLGREEYLTLKTAWVRHLRAANLPVRVAKSDKPDPAEDLVVIEGRRSTGDAARYSRYRELRARLLTKRFPPECAVCGLNPSEFYGTGRGDILEAHHLIPLSCGKRETRERDVRLVCPNCHRALHTSKPPLEISHLRKLIQHQSRR